MSYIKNKGKTCYFLIVSYYNYPYALDVICIYLCDEN